MQPQSDPYSTTYLCLLQRHVRNIVLTWLHAKVPLPMFWKWRHTGYIIGCTLERLVGTVKVKQEKDGGLEACPWKKISRTTPSRTSEKALLKRGNIAAIVIIVL